MPATPSPLPPCGDRLSRSAASLAALLLATLASGCGASEDKFPPPCPALSLLTDAGDVTRFDGAGHDVTNMIMHARIVAVPAKCDAVEPGKVRATLHVEADMARGPAAREATLQAGYFVAVTEGQTVLQEQDFSLSTRFPSNVNQTTVKAEDIEMLLPISRTKSAAAFHIYVGFRLSPDDLSYNRMHRLP